MPYRKWGIVAAALVAAAACTDHQLGTTGPAANAVTGGIAVGARVSSNAANIRSAPSINGTLLGQQPVGALGTVIGGPVTDSAGDGLTRWNVDFDTGPDGWAAQDYLTLVATPPPPPPPPPPTGTFGIGARVSSQAANIRATPSVNGTLLGQQPVGSQGTITAGPVVDSAGDGLTRWNVNFDSGPDGWAAQDYLVLVNTAPPPVSVASVTVTPASASVAAGATTQFSAVVKDSAGNVLLGRTIAWTSSNAAVATVSASGLATGAAAGTTTISAATGGKSGSAALTVTAGSPPPPPPPPPGGFTIGARVSSQAANIRSAPSINGTLLGQQPSGALGTIIGGPVVDSAGDGLTRWNVSFDTGPSGWAAQDYLAVVTAGPPPASVASVTVSPASASVTAGSSQSFSATARDSVGNVLSGHTFTWTSSNTSVATVNGSGVATGVSAGTATISASTGGKTGSAMLTVTAPPPPPPPPPGGSQFGHVVIVVEENNDYSSVIGSSSMPYLNSLANQGAVATQYFANTHPSIGNYFMLTTGQILTNDDSFKGTVSVDNIIRELNAAGVSWKSYAEDLPSVGYLTEVDNGTYASRHNPVVYFSDVQNSAAQAQNVVPFTQFATDLANGTLPQFSFVVPNLCDDAHDCSLSTADGWLQSHIAPLLASSQFQQDGLLIVTFDESSSDNTGGGGRVAWVAVGPKVKPGFRSSTMYQHQNTLREMLQGLGVTVFPGAAATASSMAEFFNP